jgi:hypothetical protein
MRLTTYGEPVEGTRFGRYRLIELLGHCGKPPVAETVYHYVAAMGYDDTPGARAVWIADPGFSPFGLLVRLRPGRDPHPAEGLHVRRRRPLSADQALDYMRRAARPGRPVVAVARHQRSRGATHAPRRPPHLPPVCRAARSQTDRLPRPHRSGHLRDRHLPLPRPARRGRHHPRRPKGPLAHRRDLAVGHRDLPSMAMTSGRLPLTTRPTRPYRPKETRPWKARPPSDTGRPVTPTCNNQHPNRVSANPPPPTTAARKIEARASCN